MVARCMGNHFRMYAPFPPPPFSLCQLKHTVIAAFQHCLNYIIKWYSPQQDGKHNMPTSSYIRMFLIYQCFHMSFIHVHSMGFTRPHFRQVVHVYYQLFDSKMADGDQLWCQCRSSKMIYYAEMHRQTVEKLT